MTQAIKAVTVTAAGGHDTFTYQYNEPLDNGAAGTRGIGLAIITDFNKRTDILRFHDEADGDLTQANVNAHAKVLDHADGHSVRIVLETTGGLAAGTVVLKGVGTLHHHFGSIDALVAHGYRLEFG
jgi:hypothetical protein